MGGSGHGSMPHFLAPCSKQAHLCIFCLLQLSQLQCSFPDSQSSSPGQGTVWGWETQERMEAPCVLFWKWSEEVNMWGEESKYSDQSKSVAMVLNRLHWKTETALTQRFYRSAHSFPSLCCKDVWIIQLLDSCPGRSSALLCCCDHTLYIIPLF